jgi:hypothetical protein
VTQVLFPTGETEDLLLCCLPTQYNDDGTSLLPRARGTKYVHYSAWSIIAIYTDGDDVQGRFLFIMVFISFAGFADFKFSFEHRHRSVEKRLEI